VRGIVTLLNAVLLLVLTIEKASSTDWAVVAISGDSEIAVFDNARAKLSQEFSPVASSIVQLTNDDRLVDGGRRVHENTADNIIASIRGLRGQTRSNCLIYFTSHGQKAAGVFIRRANSNVGPSLLNELLKDGCPKRKTVILISACYSGQFINDEMKGASRIILTSARSDRTSFGCSSDFEFPYWDECVFQNLKEAGTWKSLYEKARACVSVKENERGFEPSEPQAFFGSKVTDLRIFD
jgi:hypothetical protein